MSYDIEQLLTAADYIRSCNESDILNHYNVVQPLVTGIPKDIYTGLMMKAVVEQTAFTLLDDSCFLYYLKDSSNTATGVCFYGRGNPMGMLIMFAGIFDNPINQTVLLRLAPHSDTEMLAYKSLLQRGSVINWRRHGKPVAIRIDFLMMKLKEILKMRQS